MNRRAALGVLGATAAGISGGASLLPCAHAAQAHGKTPVDQIHAYICAFHIAKKDPRFVVEAHHYCSMLSDDLYQCVIFDRNDKNARILGVEYVVSDKLYRTLPDAEKKYYHPHSYEILSGLLIAPNMAGKEEKDLMDGLLTTWGKTWHTWPDPKTALPMGEPLLMWAATKDGQIPAKMLDERDQDFQVSTPEIRKRRAYLGAVPQIDAPKSVDDIGRQWTNGGPDTRPGK